MKRNGNRNCIGGTCIDFEQFLTSLDSQVCEIRLLLEIGDYDTFDFPSERFCDVHDEIMRQGPGRPGGRFHTPVDTGRFKDPYQDRELAISVDLFEIDYLIITYLADDDPR